MSTIEVGTRGELVWILDESGKRTQDVNLVRQIQTVGPKGGVRWEPGTEVLVRSNVVDVWGVLQRTGWKWTGDRNGGAWWAFVGGSEYGAQTLKTSPAGPPKPQGDLFG
jgi:hypothetical protein